ncbi:hypothetical protein T484DRAFT_1978576 [Baffinella frigidus]|nr:hypothetical protein T484DRAFT_1978576 [Cryptophyta sp. CCMP2293]
MRSRALAFAFASPPLLAKSTPANGASDPWCALAPPSPAALVNAGGGGANGETSGEPIDTSGPPSTPRVNPGLLRALYAPGIPAAARAVDPAGVFRWLVRASLRGGVLRGGVGAVSSSACCCAAPKLAPMEAAPNAGCGAPPGGAALVEAGGAGCPAAENVDAGTHAGECPAA